MNAVQLIGNVGSEINILNFATGKKASFSLATSETYKNKENVDTTSTTWHKVVAWGKIADTCETLIAKGKFIKIEGKIVNRSYKNTEDKTVYITEIQAIKVEEFKK